MAPAKTGRANTNKITVIKAAQTNKGIRSQVISSGRILTTVVIKFSEPKIDLAPAK